MADQGSFLNQDPAAVTGVEEPLLVMESGYHDLTGPVSQIFENFQLPLRGARVLVKPNMLGPYPPDKAVTTHPSLVSAVVDYLLQSGAKPMVGDNPGAQGYGMNERCGEVSGMASSSRGCFVNLSAAPVEINMRSGFTGKVVVSRAVLEADLVISLPKLKTHAQVILTGALKNTFGYLVGADKCRMHSIARSGKAFGEILVDIFSIRPPDLTIMDAVTAMEGNGPSNGTARHLGKVIASRDALAVDALAARLMDLDPGRLHYYREARRRWPELGQVKPEVLSGVVPVRDFSLPDSHGRGVLSYLANWLVFSFLKKSRFKIREELCDECGTCLKGCPAEAITLAGGSSRIDNDRCFACYCCQELCPQGAIEMSPSLQRLLESGGRARRTGTPAVTE
jgi:uncharacterized protein (DUF362 family)/Pyruvate/2-oxoacid:ferredoxin oxidoreductase delta subunit